MATRVSVCVKTTRGLGMGRNVVVCCDGTWNEPDEEYDGVPEPTNVSKLALAVAATDGSEPQPKVLRARCRDHPR